jgi:predicted small lipoprotein YifL
MIPTVSASGRLALLAGIIVLSLAACGRRGPLEAPPDPAAAATQRQREEVRRQRQGAAPTANPTGAATAGLTEVPAVAQARRPEGTPPVPGEDDEPDELPSNIVPSPVPTPPSGGRKRGITIPKDPFILDPLL